MKEKTKAKQTEITCSKEKRYGGSIESQHAGNILKAGRQRKLYLIPVLAMMLLVSSGRHGVAEEDNTLALVAKDSSQPNTTGPLTGAISLLLFQPPTTTTAPSVSGTTDTTTTFSATINENGTGYYLVQPAADAAPTVAAVLAGTSFAMTANVQATANINGLVASTAYKIYFVAKDTSGNTQAALGSVAVTTNAAAIPPPGFVFVTSVAYDGNLGGIAGANLKCNVLAEAAGLPGTYMAWLSNSVSSPSTTFNHLPGYKLPDGSLVVSSWADLVGGSSYVLITEDEFGDIVPMVSVYTTTKSDGTANTQFYGTCNDWMSAGATVQAGVGRSGEPGSGWTNGGLQGCNENRHLYCFQQ